MIAPDFADGAVVPPCCGTCQYLRRGADLAQGECTRYPPTAVVVPGPLGQIGTMGIWPPVQLALVCGEWQPTGLSVRG